MPELLPHLEILPWGYPQVEETQISKPTPGSPGQFPGSFTDDFPSQELLSM